MFNPRSRQISTSLFASGTPVLPQAENNLPLPPKVPVPNVSAGTLKPEPPRNRYSITRAAVDWRRGRGFEPPDTDYSVDVLCRPSPSTRPPLQSRTTLSQPTGPATNRAHRV